MSSFQETWTKAGEEPDDFEPPAGQYKVKIVDGSAFTSRAGDDYAKVILQILGGEFAGRQFQHFMGFKHEVGARINREALLAYGLRDPEAIADITDLDDAIVALKGTEAEVGVSYKDGYVQIKVHGSRVPGTSEIPTGLEPVAAGQASFAAAAGAKTDDDIPF
jgi:hypothetical protein